jgi:hypothetical protein
MNNFKVGDKVWVQVNVFDVLGEAVLVCGNADKSWWVHKRDCKPVESEPAKEPTESQKIAERTLKAIWATQDQPEVETVSAKTICVGDTVQFIGEHKRKGDIGIVKEWDSSTEKFSFVSNDAWFMRWCKEDELIRVNLHKIGNVENKIATASEINEKTKQCIVDYFVNEINARTEKGYSNWWTRELHIVDSKHIKTILEHFEEKGYTVRKCPSEVWIGW